MNIIHCNFSMEIGGIEVLVVNLLNRMVLNNNVSLIIINYKYNIELINKLDERIKVYYINRKPGSKNLIPVLRLNLLLFKLRPDIIHCHQATIASLIKIKSKLIYTIHDIGISTSQFGRYDSVVAISEAVKKDALLTSDRSIKVIKNGVDSHKFSKRNYYDSTQFSASPMKIIQVSRLLHQKKGQDILLNSLKRLKDLHNLNLKLYLVGTGPSLPYLQSLTQSLSLNSNVEFLGDKDRSWLHLNLCKFDLMVQPSRYEGFGLTIIEGFAAGIPVLASNIDGPAEIIASSSMGFLFTSESVDDCSNSILEVYSKYKNNEIKNIMKEAQNPAYAEYSINICADKYLHEYESILIK